MINVKNISFSHNKRTFISDLCITFPDSSLTAILGENGSGKTTLLSLMSKTLTPSSGKIETDGSDISLLGRDELARRLSVFPQGRPTPDMTALELVTMGRYPYTKNKLSVPRRDIDIAISALVRAGAEEFSARRLSALSYGERQRVYLAMLLAQDTQNVLLDEPTNYLDVSAKFHTMELLTSLKNEGKCVVTVLHDITLALTYADRIAVMKNGKVEAFGTPESIYESKCSEHLLGVKINRFKSDGKPVYVVEPK